MKKMTLKYLKKRTYKKFKTVEKKINVSEADLKKLQRDHKQLKELVKSFRYRTEKKYHRCLTNLYKSIYVTPHHKVVVRNRIRQRKLKRMRARKLKKSTLKRKLKISRRSMRNEVQRKKYYLKLLACHNKRLQKLKKYKAQRKQFLERECGLRLPKLWTIKKVSKMSKQRNCTCKPTFKPACGDGVTYSNACIARCANAKIISSGRCHSQCPK